MTSTEWPWLDPANTGPWPEVRDQLNSLLRGWSGYFNYGSLTLAYRALNQQVEESVRRFLVRRHKVPSRGTRRFSQQAVFGPLGVRPLTPPRRARPPHARV
jgi:RNA-directed DNA polymerase